MTKRLTLTLTLLMAAGCGESTTRVVSGKLNLTALGRSGAVAVAVGEGNVRTEALVGPDGRFVLELPAGRHAIGFRDGAQGRFFANLVNGPERRGVFAVEAGDDSIDIGEVEPVETETSSGSDDHGDHHDDECHGVDDGVATDPGAGADTDPGIAVLPMFLVVGEVPLDDDSSTSVGDDSPLHDADDDHRPDALDDDHDGDGVCDDDDHDDDDGVDGGVDDHGGNSGGSDDNGGSDGGVDDNGGDRADLPYDVKLSVGDRFQLSSAFLEKGPAPAEVLSVEMEGSSWRLDELRTNTEFEVTQADCDHEGNRGRGRDRAFIAWRNADGTTSVDHLDLRYCD